MSDRTKGHRWADTDCNREGSSSAVVHASYGSGSCPLGWVGTHGPAQAQGGRHACLLAERAPQALLRVGRRLLAIRARIRQSEM